MAESGLLSKTPIQMALDCQWGKKMDHVAQKDDGRDAVQEQKGVGGGDSRTGQNTDLQADGDRACRTVGDMAGACICVVVAAAVHDARTAGSARTRRPEECACRLFARYLPKWST